MCVCVCVCVCVCAVRVPEKVLHLHSSLTKTRKTVKAVDTSFWCSDGRLGPCIPGEGNLGGLGMVQVVRKRQVWTKWPSRYDTAQPVCIQGVPDQCPPAHG